MGGKEPNSYSSTTRTLRTTASVSPAGQRIRESSRISIDYAVRGCTAVVAKLCERRRKGKVRKEL
jgi:hypothetical protein